MHSRRSLGTRNVEVASAQSSEMLLTQLWRGLSAIHLRTQRASGACGAHWLADSRMRCIFDSIQTRLSSSE